MNLITNNETLLRYLPNALATVRGETSLFEKTEAHIFDTENWVRKTFTSDRTFNTIVGYTADNPIRTNLCRLVVAEALRTAIPALDLVFTPNGFAVTQTANLTPASKQRVDRLIGSLTEQRDYCIARLLVDLVGASQWLNSDQARFFGQTLFPDLSLIEQFGGADGLRWEKYLELQPQVIDIEATLADDYFSPDLMAAFRDRSLRHTLMDADRPVVAAIRAQTIAVLHDKPINSRRMVDVVNYIRQRPDDFPEWHTSATAQLFSPPKFQNQKKSPGYFF